MLSPKVEQQKSLDQGMQEFPFNLKPKKLDLTVVHSFKFPGSYLSHVWRVCRFAREWKWYVHLKNWKNGETSECTITSPPYSKTWHLWFSLLCGISVSSGKTVKSSINPQNVRKRLNLRPIQLILPSPAVTDNSWSQQLGQSDVLPAHPGRSSDMQHIKSCHSSYLQDKLEIYLTS